VLRFCETKPIERGRAWRRPTRAIGHGLKKRSQGRNEWVTTGKVVPPPKAKYSILKDLKRFAPVRRKRAIQLKRLEDAKSYDRRKLT